MLNHYIYHIWFKVCKPIKVKYKLSTNCLLVLNGAYLYNKCIGSFTRLQLLKFVSYYDHHRLGGYITVLITHGYIIESGTLGKGKYKDSVVYSLSEEGIKVINELKDSYNKELSIFCSKYDISL